MGKGSGDDGATELDPARCDTLTGRSFGSMVSATQGSRRARSWEGWDQQTSDEVEQV